MSGIDFDALADQALTPPAQGAKVLPFAKPGTGPDFDGLAGSVADMQTEMAKQNLLSAQGVSPDRAAKALQVSRQTGMPQPAAEENLEQATQSADLQKNVQTLHDNPGLATFVANNPLAARVAQDDFDHLSLLERMTTALKSGVSSALLTNQLGRLGNTKQIAGLTGSATPETDQDIAGVQAKLQAEPKLTGGLGIAQGFTSFLTGLVDNAVQGGSAGAVGGAVVGGGIGFFGAGIGALPGALAGAGAGALTGFNVDMASVAAGNAYLKMGQVRGSDGQQLSEAGKQFGAIFTGAATYALGTYAGAVEQKLVGETAESLASKAIEQAVTSPTFTRAMAGFAADTAKGAAQGAAVMSAMEASGIIGEEIAKAVSSGDFKSDPAEMIERLKDAAINGAILLGGMHGAMRGLSLYGDFKNAQRAEGQAAMLKNLMEGSTESKLRERDLQGFQDFMQQQTDGTPVEHLYIPAEKVRELYQGMRIDPATMKEDPLFGFVPDMAKQLEEAQAVAGDVVIPTADFVTHLAGTPLAEKLLPDMRVGADAMSVNEAKAFQKEYEARVKSATDQAGNEPVQSPAEKIVAEVRSQATAAGYSDTVASKHAAIYAARYSARAERRGLGEDPYALYKAEGPTIRAPSAAADIAPRSAPTDTAPRPKPAETPTLGPSATKDQATADRVALKKRASVLDSIVECLG